MKVYQTGLDEPESPVVLLDQEQFESLAEFTRFSSMLLEEHRGIMFGANVHRVATEPVVATA